MPERVTFGIVGLGGIAQAQHLPNLKRCARARLKTLCDLRAESVRDAQAKYGVPQGTTDFAALLSDPEIGAVVVATQEDAQARLTVQALRAGKHVYVEKPLARTVAECEEVARAQEETGRSVVVGFNRRLAPALLKVKEVLAKAGGARHLHYRIADNAGDGGRQRVIRELCHIFDLLRCLTASEAVTVYCAESRADEEAYVLKFASGAVASITASGYVTRDLPKERLEVFTQQGAVTMEDFVEVRTYGQRDFDHVYRFAGHSHPDREFTHKYLLQVGGAEALHMLRRMAWELGERHARSGPDDESPDREELARYIPHVKGTNPRWNYMVDKGWQGLLDYFAACILDGRRPELAASARDGLAASRLAHAAIASRESGQAMTVDGEGGK